MTELIPLTEVSLAEAPAATARPRRPEWLKARAPSGENYSDVLSLMREKGLNTVCEEARCPNLGECWNHRTATFLLLGDTCTRGCRYCAIGKGKPKPIDEGEPERVASSVAHLRLKFAVLTSVNRDDQPDGGAHIFARTIELIREYTPSCQIEVLIPDFDGNWDALQQVLDARPDVLNHNIESIARLFRRFRPRATFDQSIELLARARAFDPQLVTKSGMMVGAGETNAEVLEVLDALRGADVNVLTIGQYLAPDASYWPVDRYVTPAEFTMYREEAFRRGFRHVESGPLVRSSYNAHAHVGASQH
ncbi:lipoyl synthase [Chloroflexales bacterium ZM16-3]|nr:lipoyl synthase [Chloroflexales bacterium ZM16-3]